jgi:hypothetical protein
MIPTNEFCSLDSFYQPSKGIIDVTHQHPSPALQSTGVPQRQIRPSF